MFTRIMFYLSTLVALTSSVMASGQTYRPTIGSTGLQLAPFYSVYYKPTHDGPLRLKSLFANSDINAIISELNLCDKTGQPWKVTWKDLFKEIQRASGPEGTESSLHILSLKGDQSGIVVPNATRDVYEFSLESCENDAFFTFRFTYENLPRFQTDFLTGEDIKDGFELFITRTSYDGKKWFDCSNDGLSIDLLYCTGFALAGGDQNHGHILNYLPLQLGKDKDGNGSGQPFDMVRGGKGCMDCHSPKLSYVSVNYDMPDAKRFWEDGNTREDLKRHADFLAAANQRLGPLSRPEKDFSFGYSGIFITEENGNFGPKLNRNNSRLYTSMHDIQRSRAGFELRGDLHYERTSGYTPDGGLGISFDDYLPENNDTPFRLRTKYMMVSGKAKTDSILDVLLDYQDQILSWVEAGGVMVLLDFGKESASPKFNAYLGAGRNYSISPRDCADGPLTWNKNSELFSPTTNQVPTGELPNYHVYCTNTRNVGSLVWTNEGVTPLVSNSKKTYAAAIRRGNGWIINVPDMPQIGDRNTEDLIITAIHAHFDRLLYSKQ